MGGSAGQHPGMTSEDLADRIVQDINGGLSSMTLYLGYRLGLLETLGEGGPMTSVELAKRTGFSERYLREWLSAMAAGRYLSHEPTSDRFALPPEHAPILLDRDNPAYTIPFVGFTTGVAAALPALLEAFKTGSGVPYAAYGSGFVEAQGLQSRVLFLTELADRWIGAMPDVRDRLAAGGRALDVGCGIGWAAIALARGFPKATIDAVDPDATSLMEARRNVEAEGVSDRVILHGSTIEEAPIEGPYDLVTAFEVVHDLSYPVKGLRKMRELASPGGTVLIVDEAVGETVEENTNFMGHLFYNFSVLHCLPQSMTVPDSAATGTVMSQFKLTEYAKQAGFSSVAVLPVDHPMFRLYRLTP